jgi:putative flippase GtrA
MQPELATQADQGLMGAASALAHRLHLPTTLMKFVIVGGAAFLVYQVFLFLFYDSPVFWFLPDKDTEVNFILFTHPDIRLLISSVIAVELAILIQFNSHERWTFRHRPRAGWIGLRFIKFNASSIVSPIIIVVTTNVLTLAFDVSPYLSSIVGVLIGFAWNWTMTSLIVWPKHRSAPAAIAAADDDPLTV